MSIERGDDAIIRAVFCADPRPIKVSWRWSSFQLEAGSGTGRFVAEALHKVNPNHILSSAHNNGQGETNDIFDLTLLNDNTTQNTPPRFMDQALFTYSVRTSFAFDSLTIH